MAEKQESGERESKPPERKSVPPIKIGEKTADALKRYLGSVGVLIDKNASERAKESAEGMKGALEEKLDRHDSKFNRALGAAEEQKKAAEAAVEEARATKGEYEKLKESVGGESRTVESYKAKVEEYRSKIEEIEKQREREKAEREEERAKTEGVIRGLQTAAAEAMYNVNEVLKQLGLVRQEQKGVNRRLDDVEKTVAYIEKEVTNAAIDSETARDAAVKAQEISRKTDSDVDSLKAEVNNEVKEMVKQEVLRLSQAPPPSAEAMQKDKDVVSEPPSAVELPKPDRSFLPPVEFGVDEDGEEATKEVVTETPVPVVKPQLKIVRNGKKEYPDATMEKAKEQADMLEEMEPDVEDVVGAVKDMLKKLKIGTVLAEQSLGYREKKHLETIEGREGRVAKQTAENLGKAYSFIAKIKSVEHALAALASRNQLGKERTEMLDKLRDARKPLSEFKLKDGDVNEAQKYSEALIKSQKDILKAMAKTFGAVLDKIEGGSK